MVVAALASAGALACGDPRDREELPPAARGTAPRSAYFPVGAFTGSDSARANWYAGALAAMSEPSLVEHRGEVLRFLWLRTFHRPMAVRLAWQPGGCLVVLSILDGRAAESLGSPWRRDSTVTDAARCDAVRASLMAAGFAQPQPPNVRKRDGSEWVFEGNGASGYHVVARWSPELSEPSRPFAAAGRAFLALAAWDQAPDDPIY